MANEPLTIDEFGERVWAAWLYAKAQVEIENMFLADKHRRLYGVPEWSPRFDKHSWHDKGIIQV